MTVTVGLIGNPVGHSLSRLMFEAAFLAEGMDARYLVVEPDEGGFEPAIDAFRILGSPGCNVTTPFKERMVPLCAGLDLSAKAAGAVNVAVALPGGGGWRGYNTDGTGMVSFLLSRGVRIAGRQVVVLGAGGAARGIATALAAEDPAGMLIANRSAGRGEALASLVRMSAPRLPVLSVPLAVEEIGRRLAPPLLVVQATPLGTGGKGCPPFPFARLTRADVVVDAVYVPERTPVLAKAATAGSLALPGWGMLLHQGAAAFTLWFGRPAPMEAMERALRGALAG